MNAEKSQVDTGADLLMAMLSGLPSAVLHRAASMAQTREFREARRLVLQERARRELEAIASDDEASELVGEGCVTFRAGSAPSEGTARPEAQAALQPA